MTTISGGQYKGFKVRPRTEAQIRIGQDPNSERSREQRKAAETSVALPFIGVTTDGKVVPGLFPLRETSVSTQPIRDAAEAYLATLSEEQRADAVLPLDSPGWRMWSNGPGVATRHGVFVETMTPAQREAAYELLRASLSAQGYQLTRDLMRLNEALAEITGNHIALGEYRYWLSIFGQPPFGNAAGDDPWGWQIDGHHLILNCFIRGDQLVMSPTFLGAEPNLADRGPYEGTRVFEAEERAGLALVRSLSAEQQVKAILYHSILSQDLPRWLSEPNDGRQQGGAFKDNIILPYEGICATELMPAQRDLLLALLEVYTGRLRAGHDRVKLEEVKQHLDETYFAWMGGTSDESVFFYKVHSPVMLIEFDHHRGVYLDNEEPQKFHTHTIVRTPNGNDYGKDLLRQHYELHHTAR